METFGRRRTRKEDFYSKLTEKNIDEKEYGHAETVWRHFGCRSLGEYSDLYLKIDVMLLADLFENVRDIFDAMLQYTDIILELLMDYDMLLMFEKGKQFYIIIHNNNINRKIFIF